MTNAGALTRLLGYIKGIIGKGRLLTMPKELGKVVCTDSDYANGDDRTSIIRAVVTIGGNPMKAMSKTQAIVSLLSTESKRHCF